MDKQEKVAYKAAATAKWSIRLIYMFAIFGWHKSTFQFDRYNAYEQTDWYFLCFRLQRVQLFKSQKE